MGSREGGIWISLGKHMKTDCSQSQVNSQAQGSQFATEFSALKKANPLLRAFSLSCVFVANQVYHPHLEDEDFSMKDALTVYKTWAFGCSSVSEHLPNKHKASTAVLNGWTLGLCTIDKCSTTEHTPSLRLTIIIQCRQMDENLNSDADHQWSLRQSHWFSFSALLHRIPECHSPLL